MPLEQTSTHTHLPTSQQHHIVSTTNNSINTATNGTSSNVCNTNFLLEGWNANNNIPRQGDEQLNIPLNGGSSDLVSSTTLPSFSSSSMGGVGSPLDQLIKVFLKWILSF